MRFSKIKEAKKPSGHYTPAVSYGGIVYISGQVPTDPVTGQIYGEDLETQLKGVLNNLKRLLEDSNSSIENILKINIYLSDSNDWDIVNEIYADFFKGHKPARIIVPSGTFRNGYLVEIDAVAKELA